MKRQAVKSSTIRSVGYDPATKKLHIEFSSGSVYEYSDVPAHRHADLLAAPSIGSFLHTHIKGRHAHRKL